MVMEVLPALQVACRPAGGLPMSRPRAAPVETGVIVTARVTAWPATEGFSEDVTVNEGVALATFWVNVGDVAGGLAPSPE